MEAGVQVAGTESEIDVHSGELMERGWSWRIVAKWRVEWSSPRGHIRHTVDALGLTLRMSVSEYLAFCRQFPKIIGAADQPATAGRPQSAGHASNGSQQP